MHDQEVIYKNISIQGPNGIIRSGSKAKDKDGNTKDDSNKKGNGIAEVEGFTYKGCFRDARDDRVFRLESKREDMTNAV